ncbi:MAG: carbamoyltransferase C-terminal domain-containing protein [Oceanicaulis sp.]
MSAAKNAWRLGLSNTGHDGAVALVDPSGVLVFAESVERETQCKMAWGIRPDRPEILSRLRRFLGPDAADLAAATSWSRTISEEDLSRPGPFVDAATFAWLAHGQRLAFDRYEPSIAHAFDLDQAPETSRFDHHACHAAYACAASPFDTAVCLVVDGEGEEGAVSVFDYAGGKIERRWRALGRASIGGFYAWLTGLCGFSFLKGEEWKVMGLAACGTPREDWTAELSRTLHFVRGRPTQGREAEAITARFETLAASLDEAGRADLAASGQAAFAGFMTAIIETLEFAPGAPRNLVLTGGCALNSSFNGRIEERGLVDALFVPSAPADDGNAIGAALLSWAAANPDRPLSKALDWGLPAPFYGTDAASTGIEDIDPDHVPGRVTALSGDGPERVARLIAEGKIVGVMRGRAEFGPRALGHRSILADPRDPEMKDRINARVKRREGFRPFAPAILEDRTADWFDIATPSPFMATTRRWKPHAAARVPAVVHDDGTGRLQTVSAESDPWFHALISAFEAETGVPIVLNTSLNVMGKPIVHAVSDALAVYAGTGLDALVVENLLIEKT